MFDDYTRPYSEQPVSIISMIVLRVLPFWKVSDYRFNHCILGTKVSALNSRLGNMRCILEKRRRQKRAARAADSTLPPPETGTPIQPQQCLKSPCQA